MNAITRYQHELLTICLKPGSKTIELIMSWLVKTNNMKMFLPKNVSEEIAREASRKFIYNMLYNSPQRYIKVKQPVKNQFTNQYTNVTTWTLNTYNKTNSYGFHPSDDRSHEKVEKIKIDERISNYFQKRKLEQEEEEECNKKIKIEKGEIVIRRISKPVTFSSDSKIKKESNEIISKTKQEISLWIDEAINGRENIINSELEEFDYISEEEEEEKVQSYEELLNKIQNQKYGSAIDLRI